MLRKDHVVFYSKKKLLETVYCLPRYFSERTTRTRQSGTWNSYIILQFRDSLAGLWTSVVVEKTAPYDPVIGLCVRKKNPKSVKT